MSMANPGFPERRPMGSTTGGGGQSQPLPPRSQHVDVHRGPQEGDGSVGEDSGAGARQVGRRRPNTRSPPRRAGVASAEPLCGVRARRAVNGCGWGAYRAQWPARRCHPMQCGEQSRWVSCPPGGVHCGRSGEPTTHHTNFFVSEFCAGMRARWQIEAQKCKRLSSMCKKARNAIPPLFVSFCCWGKNGRPQAPHASSV